MDGRVWRVWFLVELHAGDMRIALRFHDYFLFSRWDVVDDKVLAAEKENRRRIYEVCVFCYCELKASMCGFDCEHCTVHEFSATFRPHCFFHDGFTIDFE